MAKPTFGGCAIQFIECIKSAIDIPKKNQYNLKLISLSELKKIKYLPPKDTNISGRLPFVSIKQPAISTKANFNKPKNIKTAY